MVQNDEGGPSRLPFADSQVPSLGSIQSFQTVSRRLILGSSLAGAEMSDGAESSRAWWFEQFDGVASGVFEQNLCAAYPMHDVVAEVCSCAA
jgi:hypothetical protein